MGHFRVYANLVDGTAIDFDAIGPRLLADMERLRVQGVAGGALIEALLGDDLRPPPRELVFSGTAPDGRRIDVRIPAD